MKLLFSLLRRRRWFGIPRGLCLALIVGLIIALVLYWPVLFPSARTRAAVEGLRTSSVYVEPGAPGLVDPDRARQVLGDRPIVMAIFNEEPLPDSGHINGPDYEMCEDIARLVPTNLVVVFAVDEDGEYGSSYCDGSAFPKPPDEEFFSLNVIVAAETAWTYRVSEDNLTPEIEEYALAFDVEATEQFPNGIPRRGAVPDLLARWQVWLSMAGVVAATVAVFLLLRLAGWAVRQRGRARAELDHRRAAVSARLSKLADHVTHTEPPDDHAGADRLASVAKRYLKLLNRFEGSRGAADLDVIERHLDELEGDLGVLEPTK